ncbi:MAG: hypothetical protein ACTSR3_04065 [Candidatus Helarchaeota archaeon]
MIIPKRQKKEKQEELNFITIRIRNEKKMRDLRKSEFDPKIGYSQVRGRESKETGFVIQSFRVPLEYLGLKVNSERKKVLNVLNNPELIPHKKLSEFVRKIIDTYEEIKEERNKFEYKTKRFKRKKKVPQPKQQQTA